MRISPELTGIVHFIGIGGIGMSGIAEILHRTGYNVRGSDIAANANVERLRALGIEISIEQKTENIKGASVAVVSTDIPQNNPELVAARLKGLPVVHRAEMLAEIMRLKPSIAVAGSHGKTTTTSWISHVMHETGWDPTVISGGIINAYGTNARVGSGEWIVAEADESDGSFTKLPATIAIITNIDPEHLEHYGSFDNVKKSFGSFIENLPFYGLGVICADHPRAMEIANKITDRRIVTYGIENGCDLKAYNVTTGPEGCSFDLKFSEKAMRLKGMIGEKKSTIPGFKISLIGEFNILNSIAVVASCLEIGIKPGVISHALSTFSGVKRRFSVIGSHNKVTYIDDYAHHPVEIENTIKAGKIASSGRVIAVIQPHRYSRLCSLFDDFANCCHEADEIIITPVYSAGEAPREGIHHTSLASKISTNFSKSVATVEDISDLTNHLNKIIKANDYVIFMGAGSITTWAHEVFETINNKTQTLERVGT